MFSIIFGAVAVVGSAACFWWLLPRNGVVNPLVRNSDVGSMVTIAIMSVFTLGTVLLFTGFVG